MPTRIHVNGTRGKSSVTRYIAAGMRESGRRTWAKVTGVRPTIIGPDGLYWPIKRRGGPRVQEQFRIMKQAAADDAQCLVLECMSIQPELQVLEGRFFRPHIYVLTNVKDDHREALGNDIESQIRSLCEAMQPGSHVITTEGNHLAILRELAAKRGNEVSVVAPLTREQEAALPDGVFSINVALAVAACEICGIPSHISMPEIVREASTNSRATIPSRVGEAWFVDGFAVNDVPSATEFIQLWQSRFPEARGMTVLFNARADRPLRSQSFARYLPTVRDLDRITLIGNHARYMRRALISAGFAREAIILWSHREAVDVTRCLSRVGVGAGHLVIGLGNIGGDGHLISESLAPEVAYAV